jgi:hypothetical protein
MKLIVWKLKKNRSNRTLAVVKQQADKIDQKYKKSARTTMNK